MAAYRRVYDSRHLQAACQEPGSAPEPCARQSNMGYLYLFITVQDMPRVATSFWAETSSIYSTVSIEQRRVTRHIDRLGTTAYGVLVYNLKWFNAKFIDKLPGQRFVGLFYSSYARIQLYT